jgi:3-phosphoglycerate kinase
VPKKIVDHMENGDVALLENVRFQPGEEANDPEFAKALAELR